MSDELVVEDALLRAMNGRAQRPTNNKAKGKERRAKYSGRLCSRRLTLGAWGWWDNIKSVGSEQWQ